MIDIWCCEFSCSVQLPLQKASKVFQLNFSKNIQNQRTFWSDTWQRSHGLVADHNSNSEILISDKLMKNYASQNGFPDHVCRLEIRFLSQKEIKFALVPFAVALLNRALVAHLLGETLAIFNLKFLSAPLSVLLFKLLNQTDVVGAAYNFESKPNRRGRCSVFESISIVWLWCLVGEMDQVSLLRARARRRLLQPEKDR